MNKLVHAAAGLILALSTLSGYAATDPTLACGVKKAKILQSYDKCLDKALPILDFEKQTARLAKCHEKCTKGFTKAEDKKDVTCAQEDAIGFYCGDGSSTHNEAVCRQQYFLLGSSGCYP